MNDAIGCRRIEEDKEYGRMMMTDEQGGGQSLISRWYRVRQIRNYPLFMGSEKNSARFLPFVIEWVTELLTPHEPKAMRVELIEK